MAPARRLSLSIVGVLAATLTFAGAARAAITGSSITAPRDLSFLSNDNDAGGTDFTISGTTTGGNPASDRIDVRCYYGAGVSVLVRSDRSLNPDGSFSFAAPLGAVEDHICRLRAIPAGSFPSDLAPFAGPRVATGERQTFTVAGGPNVGKTYDFYLWAQQRTAAVEYGSLGTCALFAGHLFDAALNQTTDTFFCNAWFTRFDAPSATRSELRIDGANAYPVWAAADINGSGAGLPALNYSSALDPITGNLVIHDSEPLVKCADPTYPPTATSCATFAPTGVTYTSTVSQDHDGHLSVIADRFASTDGAAHSLDLEWENDQRFHGFSGDSRQLAYRFPGQTAFAKHSPGDVVPLAATGGTILIRMDGAADGDPGTGRGAIVYDRPAHSATFIYADANVQEFNLPDGGRPAGRLDRVPLRVRAGLHGRRRRGARRPGGPGLRADARAGRPAPAEPRPAARDPDLAATPLQRSEAAGQVPQGREEGVAAGALPRRQGLAPAFPDHPQGPRDRDQPAGRQHAPAGHQGEDQALTGPAVRRP